MAKQQAIHANGQWRILETNAKGEESTRDTVPDVEGMTDEEAIGVFQGLVSQAPNKRRAALSLGVGILRLCYGKMEDFKGEGDPETGQLSNTLKDTFRKGEDAYFEQFMDDKHPMHKHFVGRLPKVNERGEALDTKKTAILDRFTYFVTSLRKDPSYGQAKNLLLNYWAFVGQDPFTLDKAGNVTIIPPEVMRVHVAAAKDVKPADNSWAAQFTGLCRELIIPADPKKPVSIPDERLADCVTAAQDALFELQRLAKLAEARASAKAKPGDVVTATKEAMGKANEKREAGAPKGKVTVALE